MRVIAGTRGGRKLVAPDTSSTRPVADRVKESLFSSIAAEIPGAVVADLFAGAGSFGIEALSRGAAEAVFVENGRKALAALRDNLESLDLDGGVIALDVAKWDPDRDFDIVFCDPPWPMGQDDLEETLERIAPAVVEEGLVVVTRRSSDPVPTPGAYRIDDERTIGGTRIIRYRKETQ